MIGRVYHIPPSEMGLLYTDQFEEIAADLKQLEQAAAQERRG